MIVVGVGYKKGSGKDCVADYLVKNYGFYKISFAKALKEGCMSIFGFTSEQVYGNLKETMDDFWNATPRQILQIIGTDLLRNKFDKNIWIKSVQKQILTYPHLKWVISDVRFLNEVKFIKDSGGTLVHINRDNNLLHNKFSNHESEYDLSNFKEWDYTIDNNKNGLHNLYYEIDKFIDWFYSTHRGIY